MTRSAGNVDYERQGGGYAVTRRTDPRILAVIHAALGQARTVLNVGAGAGSYEPLDRYVIAVEPSRAMRAQRPSHLAPAIDAIAEKLPLDDRSVDASMAIITVHQWSDPERGLGELRRVTRGPVLVVTFDINAFEQFWLTEYTPDLVALERRRFPSVDTIRHFLGGKCRVEPIPVPIDCVDGFVEAYYARPEQLLDPQVRRAQSGWTFLEPSRVDDVMARLRADLESGAWDARHGTLRSTPEFEGSLRLIVSEP